MTWQYTAAYPGGAHIGVQLPHEAAEVVVLEVLWQHLARELGRPPHHKAARHALVSLRHSCVGLQASRMLKAEAHAGAPVAAGAPAHQVVCAGVVYQLVTACRPARQGPPCGSRKRKPRHLLALYTGSRSLARRMQQPARPSQTRKRQAGLPRRGPHVLRRKGAGAGASGGMITRPRGWAGWLRLRGFARAALPAAATAHRAASKLAQSPADEPGKLQQRLRSLRKTSMAEELFSYAVGKPCPVYPALVDLLAWLAGFLLRPICLSIC